MLSISVSVMVFNIDTALLYYNTEFNYRRSVYRFKVFYTLTSELFLKVKVKVSVYYVIVRRVFYKAVNFSLSLYGVYNGGFNLMGLTITSAARYLTNTLSAKKGNGKVFKGISRS